jgi:hypothetical protein
MAQPIAEEPRAEPEVEPKRDLEIGHNVAPTPAEDSKDASLDEQKPEGVEQVEAITKLWTKKWLWITFVL